MVQGPSSGPRCLLYINWSSLNCLIRGKRSEHLPRAWPFGLPSKVALALGVRTGIRPIDTNPLSQLSSCELLGTRSCLHLHSPWILSQERTAITWTVLF